MTARNMLMAAAGGTSTTADVAEAIDFDGTNDGLSRGSDLTGNTDGKTFTFSGWVWVNSASATAMILDNSGSFFSVRCNSSNFTQLIAYNSASTAILSATVSNTSLVNAMQNTFANILISIDLANPLNRHIYINDVSQTATWSVYTNDIIDFTTSDWQISRPGARLRARLAHVYLDYTYRDLSVEANRRLFVTADLKPAAGQAALNPILYLPLSDPTQPGKNMGTGGNFTLTGTVARSGRGPNQYNAPYSTFTGTNYLQKLTAMTGLADGTAFTLSFVLGYTTSGTVLSFSSSGTERFRVVLSGNTIGIWGFNSSGTEVLRGNVNTALVTSRNYQITISLDLSNTSKRHVYINGVSSTVNWITYNTAGVIDFAPTTPNFQVGGGYGFLNLNGRLGSLWFNTNYTDLTVAENLAKFVEGTGINAKPVDLGVNGELPTGTSPLIYVPLYANNAGKNYGTGGDFTVTSGTPAGARGANEFWGNLLNPGNDGSGGGGAGIGGLRRLSSLTGAADSKTFSFSFWTRITDSFSNFFTLATSGGELISAFMDNSSYINLRFRTSDGVLNSLNQNTAALNTNVLNQIFGCVDTNGVCRLFVNGVQVRQLTFSSNLDILFGSINGNAVPGTTTKFGRNLVGEFYFTTDYIDFSQEANRLKFRDAFGNPVDLTQQIEAEAIPNPAIYLRFDPASFGTNLGTGGAFTPSGTILDGGQF